MRMEQEKWVPVVGYEGLYEVSNLGRLKKLPRLTPHSRHGFLRKKQKITIGSPCVQGYLRISLYKNGAAESFKMHRLVALAFLPNPESKPSINHKNGNKADNRLENIEWCTVKENWDHAFKTGLHTVTGTANPKCKLSDDQVIEIYKAEGFQKDIARKYNVSQSLVSAIKIGRNWTHITQRLAS